MIVISLTMLSYPVNYSVIIFTICHWASFFYSPSSYIQNNNKTF